MNYDHQWNYFKMCNCEFKYDEAVPSWSFSKVHVFYDGVEIATMYEDHSIVADGLGFWRTYPYNGFYTYKEFQDRVDEAIENTCKTKIPDDFEEESQIRDERLSNVRSYFKKRKRMKEWDLRI